MGSRALTTHFPTLSRGVPVAPPYITTSATSLRSSPTPPSLEKTFSLAFNQRCELCEYNYAKHLCVVCGRRVCDKDYDELLGMCVVCRDALCNVCNRNLSVSRCSLCGRLVCSKCSIDLDGVRRVCFLCLISKGTKLITSCL